MSAGPQRVVLGGSLGRAGGLVVATNPTDNWPWLSGAAVATLGLAYAVGRWSLRHLRAFVALFTLTRKMQALDARVGTIETSTATKEELMALRTEVMRVIAREHREHTEAVTGVRAELRTIKDRMADKEDTTRIEGKLDRLLVQGFRRPN